MRPRSGLLNLFVLSAATLAAAGGCRSGDPDQKAEPGLATGPEPGTAVPWTIRLSPADPVPAEAMLASLTVYGIRLPEGSVSRSDAFWSRVDEQAVDVATYDVLFKNGFRVGIAALDDWPSFRDVIERDPSRTTTTALSGIEGKEIELPLRKDVATQTLLTIDGSGRLSGRSYDQAENLLLIGFLPAPKRPGVVRVSLVPVVRSARKRLEWRTGAEAAVEVQYVAPERRYELNLRADIPPGRFLVIAPSPEAASPTSVGRAFLTTDDGPERSEFLLVIVPRPLKTTSITVTPAAK